MRILNGFGKLVATKQEVFHEPVIQTTTPVNPGNNGEPLVDSDDRVAGIHSTALMDAQSISFVIPINIVKFFITELQTQPNNPARSVH
jgi:S1-C subfamily serine protease